MSACESSAAVQTWHDECGAHESAFTQCVWPSRMAAGMDGTRMSRMTTFDESIVTVAR